ncbi:MAG TPA: ABC transporter substrate-binding protein [Acetobacteraceae bacterium]|nr:ABC transporter substrate-binding protein [Acetobacteraceae bacterium]
MISRRAALAGGLAVTGAVALGQHARAKSTPGVTATELKIGNTMPYSGPASSYAPIGKTESAFFNMVNDKGGIAGRKINFISLDDGYLPPRTVEDVRRLVEQDEVAFLFNTLGTPTNTAIEKYLNHAKVPQLFVATGADKWGDYKEYPWTIGLQPSYRTEAQIYAKYALKQKPDAKIAFLYQNDDFGKDYLNGVRDILGANWDKYVVKAVSYEATDPTIDSQITTLQGAGADVLICATAPKQAAQAIRKVHDLNWHPMFFMTNVSISSGSVMQPAGAENGVGIITSGWLKDQNDPAWKDDPGMNEWRAFMAKNMPGADLTDNNYVYGFTASRVMLHVLEACNGNFSRENVMKQATGIQRLEVPTLLPGLVVATSPTNYHPIRAMQLQKWDGKTWVRFGEVIEGTNA